MDEKQAVKGLIRGDEQSLGEIIRLYTPLVSTIVRNISRESLTRSDIEEVCADVFVTLWQNRSTLREETVRGYICCIAKSRAKDRLRRTDSIPAADIDEAEPAAEGSVADSCENKELKAALREEIDALGEPDREIIIRHYYYYQTTAMIAGDMGIKTETVKSRLKRAREKLGKALRNRGY